MPEGDTIHRSAARLRAALAGRPLVHFEARRASRPWPAPGTMVVGVEARGKHLLVRFDDGWTLRTHLRMTGSWHLYRPGERWRKPSRLAAAVLEVGGGAADEGWVAVCFSAPVAELVREARTDHLGPDLCVVGVDLDEVVRLIGAVDPATPLAEVLLDQRICCGVGNVYKSEVPFALGIHPLVPIGALDDARRRAVVETAARQLQANLTTSARTTVAGPPGALGVYGRRGRPCRRCGTPIEWARTGRHARSTYWCPTCQPTLPR